MSFQEYVDRQFNSQSYRNELAANPIIGVNPQAVEDEPEDVELHAGKIFELKDQYSIDDFINFSSYFPHTKSIIALHHLVCTTSNSIMKK